MLKRIINSPWSGAMVALASAIWQGFWLVGPPLGLTKSDERWYLALGLFALLLSGGQAFYVLKREIKKLKELIHSAPNLVARGISSSLTNVGAEFYHMKIAND